MDDVVERVEDTYGLDRQSAHNGPWRRLLRSTIHFFAYNFILTRRTTRVTRAAGFRLIVRPTVFHPRYFRGYTVDARVSSALKQSSGEDLPAPHAHIDMSRVDLDTAADAAGHFGCD